MRSRVCVSQACGSTSFIFAVCKSVATVAQVRPPPADPANNAFFRVIVCGRMARSTMLESISTRPSLRKRSRAARRESGVADRLGEFGFPGQARQFRFPQVEEPCHNGGGLFLAGFHPCCGILAADVLFDLPERSHGRDRLRRQPRAFVHMQFVEPPPDMGKTGGQRHAIIAAPVPLASRLLGRITVHLQQPAKSRQMTRDTITAPAVFEAIGHHGRTSAAEGSVVPGIGP